MRQYLTQTIEDYLKTIYLITTSDERASTNQIAEAMGVTPASVTGMVKKLSETNPPLLEYKSHRGVVLTREGEQIAIEIVRHHRLIEMFLHQVLGYAWDEVHDEADRLEHVISENFEDRIAQVLGNPTHDPHGDPIPSRDLYMTSVSAQALSNLRLGQKAIIYRVTNTDPALLRYLSELGLTPGKKITAVGFSPFDDNLSLRVQDRSETLILGLGITENIFVELCAD